jgi:hypothetical protein
MCACYLVASITGWRFEPLWAMSAKEHLSTGHMVDGRGWLCPAAKATERMITDEFS